MLFLTQPLFLEIFSSENFKPWALWQLGEGGTYHFCLTGCHHDPVRKSVVDLKWNPDLCLQH